jgi:hypothetical protein
MIAPIYLAIELVAAVAKARKSRGLNAGSRRKGLVTRMTESALMFSWRTWRERESQCRQFTQLLAITREIVRSRRLILVPSFF